MSSLKSIAALTATASLFVFTSACSTHHHGEDDYRGYTDRPPTTNTPRDQCLIAATPGGDGAPGGLVSIRTANAPTLDGAITQSGGEQGLAGEHTDGPEADPGLPGNGGSSEVLQDATILFDTAQVPPGSVFQAGVPNAPDTFTIAGSEASPIIAVERFEIGPDTTVILSRFPTIIAQDFIIGPGARLVLRDEGESKVTSSSIGDEETPGQNGSTVTIIAQSVQISGTVDISGSDGAESQDGGFGGHLLLRSENLTIDLGGAINADGGHGGDGLAEAACTTSTSSSN